MCVGGGAGEDASGAWAVHCIKGGSVVDAMGVRACARRGKAFASVRAERRMQEGESVKCREGAGCPDPPPPLGTETYLCTMMTASCDDSLPSLSSSKKRKASATLCVIERLLR